MPCGTTRTVNSITTLAERRHAVVQPEQPVPGGLPAPYGNAAGLAIAPRPEHQRARCTRRTFRTRPTGRSTFSASCRSSFVVTAAYVGNVGVHLMTPIQFNQIPDSDLALGSKLISVVPNPFYGVITDPSSTLSLSTVQYGQLLRPFPQFLNVKAINVGAGHSSYQCRPVDGGEAAFARV